MSVWKNTKKKCFWFIYNVYQRNNLNGTTYNVFNDYNWSFWHQPIVYPYADLTGVSKHKVTTIKPDSVLYFDAGSGFPRFKLGLSTNKRCIKPSKADLIVVSGDVNRRISDDTEYCVIECTDAIYFVEKDEFNTYFNGNLSTFCSRISKYQKLENPNIIYTGRLAGYDKHNVYLAKYLDGEYTIDYITDVDLDKIINKMCPEPTYEELSSIVDMLNSEDAATVQLGVKMIQGYNVDKYKMTLRLILCTRQNWWLYTRNTVGTKQLMETLNLDRYKIQEAFQYGCRYVAKDGETYTIEDVALAKRLANKMLTQYFQEIYNNNFLKQGYEWLPDERKIELK